MAAGKEAPKAQPAMLEEPEHLVEQVETAEPETRAARIAARLMERGESLAVAESATGGLILSLLTDVPGASAWLRGGVVAYTNAAKAELLSVPTAVLEAHGAVSAETVAQMALGARRIFRADWALAETGIAGPQTARRSSKPAGLTYLAVARARPEPGATDGAGAERETTALPEAGLPSGPPVRPQSPRAAMRPQSQASPSQANEAGVGVHEMRIPTPPPALPEIPLVRELRLARPGTRVEVKRAFAAAALALLEAALSQAT